MEDRLFELKKVIIIKLMDTNKKNLVRERVNYFE